MSNQFLPEGRILDTIDNRRACASLTALQKAKEQSLILEGRALMCTSEHHLMVSFGPFTGVIPRTETAIGIREGTTREIAILSKVGHPVAFTIQNIYINEDGPAFLLSRKRAQELCLQNLLYCTPLRSVLPATVTHLAPFGAFVDIGCGFPSMVGVENISISRITHSDQRFSLGQEIYVLLTGLNATQGRVFLSHKELLGTWHENANRFRNGMTVPGYVRGIKEYGAFVELAPNLTGLADRSDTLIEGDRVSVYIKSILPDKMKVKLNVIHRLEHEAPPQTPEYFIRNGQLPHWSFADKETIPFL